MIPIIVQINISYKKVFEGNKFAENFIFALSTAQHYHIYQFQLSLSFCMVKLISYVFYFFHSLWISLFFRIVIFQNLSINFELQNILQMT